MNYFLYMVSSRGPNSYFCMWMFNFPVVSFEKIILSSMNCLGTLIKHELTINVWVHFCKINFFVDLYLMSLPHCIDYCHCSQEIWGLHHPPPPEYCIYSGFLEFPYKFYDHFVNVCKEANWDLHWICRSLWGILPF